MGQKKSQRWQIIGFLKYQTKTEREIAELVGVLQKCENTTKRNFQATSRVNNFENYKGHPTTSYRQIAADFNSKFKEHKISRESVRRVLAKKGIESYSAVKKLLLIVSDRTKRYKWCKERRNWTDKDWDKSFSKDSKMKNIILIFVSQEYRRAEAQSNKMTFTPVLLSITDQKSTCQIGTVSLKLLLPKNKYMLSSSSSSIQAVGDRRSRAEPSVDDLL
ncbi:hypothetical protein BpHYR1_042757 [Brachionus plicatilis]|uniref:Transposase Tc1-like domain-containing protein n=1 Tax=Brachionus plicatilis TaxID=10195 RepID=A0A3M7R854_BRAPC|nr:hypothetical protein BpHYR1_042757 [Brachionus plicatilis]